MDETAAWHLAGKWRVTAAKLYESAKQKEEMTGEEARFLRGVAAGHEECAIQLEQLLEPRHG